ncbi:hypothetical protein C8R43DRAFT_1242563 [Mycena crocata]|nr:hypothetical protein C8R43DRAFT_1242563 [Mycena crocata]
MAPTASILTFTSSKTTCGDGHRLTLNGMPMSSLPKDCPAGMTWRSSASRTYTYPNESKTLEWPRCGVSMTDDRTTVKTLPLRFPLGDLGKYFKWKVIENNQSRLEANLVECSAPTSTVATSFTDVDTPDEGVVLSKLACYYNAGGELKLFQKVVDGIFEGGSNEDVWKELMASSIAQESEWRKEHNLFDTMAPPSSDDEADESDTMSVDY